MSSRECGREPQIRPTGPPGVGCSQGALSTSEGRTRYGLPLSHGVPIGANRLWLLGSWMSPPGGGWARPTPLRTVLGAPSRRRHKCRHHGQQVCLRACDPAARRGPGELRAGCQPPDPLAGATRRAIRPRQRWLVWGQRLAARRHWHGRSGNPSRTNTFLGRGAGKSAECREAREGLDAA